MGLKLHLGCGTRRLGGYVHIDSRKDVLPDICRDITDLSLYGMYEVNEIYACHVLEHMADPVAALAEWNRVLMPHGKLYLSVPDFESLVACYNRGVHLDRLHGLLHGRQDYKENLHYHSWDYETLANLLRECGYYDVKTWFTGHYLPEDYHDISMALIYTKRCLAGIPVSLNVVGKKI